MNVCNFEKKTNNSVEQQNNKNKFWIIKIKRFQIMKNNSNF